ncbi:MAG TPA: hypothetical protein VF137_08705 [Candidatus Dormibacteraeota bacterium]
MVEARGPGSHWGVLPGLGDSYDTVAIAGFDGFARARATFKPRAVPTIPGAAAGTKPLLPPPAIVAAGSVFYADGDGAVRQLKPDGAVSDVTSFNLTPQQELWFAVSPDGKNLMASVLTVPGPGASWSVSLEMATPGGQPKTLSTVDLGAALPKPTLVAGWDLGGPLATLSTDLVPTTTDGGGWQYHGGSLVHLDAQGQPGQPVGGADCKPWASAPDGSVLCTGSPPTVRDPIGNVLWTVPSGGFSPQGRALAPDAGHVSTDSVIVAADGWAERIANGLTAEGWVDSVHLVGQVQDPAGKGDIDYVTSGDALRGHNLGFPAVLVGALPTPPGIKNELPSPAPKAKPSPSPSPTP